MGGNIDLHSTRNFVFPPAPVLGDFVAAVTGQELTIEWVLRSNGIRPALNMTLTFSNPLAGQEVENRTIDLLQQPQPDNTRFNSTFQTIGAGRYLLLVVASNSELSSAVMPFTVDITVDFTVDINGSKMLYVEVVHSTDRGSNNYASVTNRH